MSRPADAPTTQQIVTEARRLERLLARRRKVQQKLAEIEHDIATTRKFLNELTRPFGEPPTFDEYGARVAVP